MSGYKVAILGASGAVGRMMVKVLEERNFPVRDLKLLATERSAGKKIDFHGEKLTIEVAHPDQFKGYDLALFSAGSSVSRSIALEAVKRGCVVIDNSNAWRMEPDVPLVVPEVNPEELENHRGIIANPNCSTIQMVVALKPIKDRFGLSRIIVSTYQAVSGTGLRAIEELKSQSLHMLNGETKEPEVYPYPIAFNLLPHIDTFSENGYSREEMKMINETRKILKDPKIKIAATAVRVPVFYGHSESIYIKTIEPAEVIEIRQVLSKAPGVVVYDNLEKLQYPMPNLVEDNDQVWVGRIRRDLDEDCGYHLWVVANNLRKGAATNAVQIGEELMKRGLL
ncbi:aspartate-semialdehyde dehydrogenase [Anoxybacter fermentans]|uniref:aspartate-semialdehyde dehydrogenase n=1 Tax=Anoxybacter fermentans TaxID=1323375 RepID=UPI001F00FAF9|nr:aspartate-semialdehyde dehydrogenase [Anoxybacter fermentans]